MKQRQRCFDQKKPQYKGQKGSQCALAQKLSYDLPAGGTHDLAHSHFLGPLGRARSREVHVVDACDEKNDKEVKLTHFTL